MFNGGAVRKRTWLTWTTILALLTLVLASCGPGDSPGEDANEAWEPTREAVITVPFTAGGGTDTFARTLAKGLEELRPGLTVVVENRTGASGAIGFSYVHQRKGDPHQLLASGTNIVTVPMTKDVNFTSADFTAIGQPITQIGMAVAKAGKYDGLQDLIEQAKQKPQTVALGSTSDLFAISAKLMESATGAQFKPVIFNSGPEITRAALTGDTDLGISAPENAIQFVDDGRMDALAVFSEERIDQGSLAEVPTAKEQGIDVALGGVRGLWAAPEITEAQRTYWVNAFEEWTTTKAYDDYIKDTKSISEVRVGEDFEAHLEDFRNKVQPILSQ